MLRWLVSRGEPDFTLLCAFGTLMHLIESLQGTTYLLGAETIELVLLMAQIEHLNLDARSIEYEQHHGLMQVFLSGKFLQDVQPV